MTKDPVCGMQINENNAAGTSKYHGKTYYFCSSSCKEQFDKDPAKYAANAESGSMHSAHHHR